MANYEDMKRACEDRDLRRTVKGNKIMAEVMRRATKDPDAMNLADLFDDTISLLDALTGQPLPLHIHERIVDMQKQLKKFIK